MAAESSREAAVCTRARERERERERERASESERERERERERPHNCSRARLSQPLYGWLGNR